MARKIVYGYAFDPKPEAASGVGGFEWRFLKENRDHDYEAHRRELAIVASANADDLEWRTFEVEVDMTDNDGITAQVEAYLHA